MKTTIDLPEELFLETKVLAAQRKTTFRELVIQGLQSIKQHSEQQALEDRRAKAVRLLAALQAQNTEPMVPLKREEIYDRGLPSAP